MYSSECSNDIEAEESSYKCAMRQASKLRHLGGAGYSPGRLYDRGLSLLNSGDLEGAYAEASRQR